MNLSSHKIIAYHLVSSGFSFMQYDIKERNAERFKVNKPSTYADNNKELYFDSGVG